MAAGSIAFALIFGYRVLPQLGFQGTYRDWDLIRTLTWVPWHTIVSYHQFPVWNPYMCGGIPMLGDPHASIVTPLFLLRLIFGPVTGIHLEILVHLAIACAGGYVLARVLGLGTWAAVACAIIFPSSSWFYLHVAVGHYDAMPAAYWPWMLAAAMLAIDRRRLGYASVAGMLIALICFEGAPYETSFAVLLLAAVVIPPALARRDRWSLVVLATALAFAVGFGAVRLLPTYAMLQLHPRIIRSRQFVSLRNLALALFDRKQNCRRGRLGSYNFFEAGAYLSPIFLAFMMLGTVTRWRRAWPWILAAGIMLSLAMGDFMPLAPWAVLHHIPPFTSERIPTRLLLPFILCSGVIAAYGVDFLAGYRPQWSLALTCFLVVAGAFDAFLVGANNLADIARSSESALPVSEVFQQYHNSDGPFPQHMLSHSQANLGITECYEYTVIDTPVSGSNEPGYQGEQYLLGPGNLELLKWTPNALSYEVETPTPTTLVINQNFDRGWWLTTGTGRLVSHSGLLAIELSAGKQQLKVMNLGDGLITGALITLATVAGAMLLWRSGL